MTGHSYCTHDEGERCDCATALTADGLTAGEIAAQLRIGERTVVRLRGRAT